MKLTLTNNAVFNSLFQEVLDIDNSLIKETILNLELSEMDVSIRFSNTLSDKAIGYIISDAETESKTFIIEFQESIILLDKAIQQVVILHELLHLNLALIIYDKKAANYPDVSIAFNKYFSEYNKDFNAASHEYFAANYLNQIEDIIEIIAPDLEADKAKWASLTGTEAYEDLPLAQHEDIMNYLTENNL